MATTDAISVACKLVGIGADVYRGKIGTAKPESKYNNTPKSSTKTLVCPDCGAELWDNRVKIDGVIQCGKFDSGDQKPAFKCKANCGFKTYDVNDAQVRAANGVK